jgi:hypothetical protein
MSTDLDTSNAILEIKLNTERLVNKVEQLNDNIERLEASVENLHKSLSAQDRRLTVLEQRVPENLLQDIAIIKQHLSTYSKVLWLLGGATLTSLSHIIKEMLLK